MLENCTGPTVALLNGDRTLGCDLARVIAVGSMMLTSVARRSSVFQLHMNKRVLKAFAISARQ